MTMTKEEINATFTNIMKELRTLSLELGNDVGISYFTSSAFSSISIHDAKDFSVKAILAVNDDGKDLYADEPWRCVSTFSLDDCLERYLEEKKQRDEQESKEKEEREMWEDEMRADCIEEHEEEPEKEEDEEEDDA